MPEKYVIYKIPTFSKSDLNEVVGERDIIFFGEVHKVDWIIMLEAEIIKLRREIGKLNFVGLEYFNYRMDKLINGWLKEEITWEELNEEYSKGPEGFPLEDYKPLLDAIKEAGVPVVGVMPPRDEARKISHNGLDGIDDIIDTPVDKEEVDVNYPGYVDILLDMIPKEGPMAKLDTSKIVLAQAYKDEVISYRVAEAYKRYGGGVVITGFAHSEISGSASTRLRRRGVDSFKVLTSRNQSLGEFMKWYDKWGDYLEANYIAVPKD